MSDHLPGNFFRLHGKRSKGDRIEPKRILLRRVESLPGPITPWSCRPKPWAFRPFRSGPRSHQSFPPEPPPPGICLVNPRKNVLV